MKHKNESRGEVFRLVVFGEDAENNTLNSFEEKRKKFSILKEKVSEFRVNRKDAMTMHSIDYLKGHESSTVNGVLGSTGYFVMLRKVRLTVTRGSS